MIITSTAEANTWIIGRLRTQSSPEQNGAKPSAGRYAGHKALHKENENNNLRSIQIRIELELEEDANNDLRQLHVVLRYF